MTDPLYFDDSSQRRFDATVERVVDDRVVLDRTLFYPEGGGQPADTGVLRVPTETDESDVDGEPDAGTDADANADTGTNANGTWRIEDVQKRDTIYHHLALEDGQEPPTEGTTVEGALDWDRRDAHMRYHTAQHLLSAVLLESFDAPTTGNQLYDDRARLDCAYDRFTDDDLEIIEYRLNDLIDADLPVRWYELERETAEERLDTERTRIDLLPESITELRIVEIGDEDDPFDRVACAGTHVERTGKIGRLEVTGRETAGSDAERIRFCLSET